jgi:hypothetical protein
MPSSDVSVGFPKWSNFRAALVFGVELQGHVGMQRQILKV